MEMSQVGCWCEKGARGLILETKGFQGTVIYSTSSNKVFALAKCLAFKCGICCSLCAGACPGGR